MNERKWTKVLVFLLFFGIVFSGCEKKGPDKITPEEPKLILDEITPDAAKLIIEEKHRAFVDAVNDAIGGDFTALNEFFESTVTEDAVIRNKEGKIFQGRIEIKSYWTGLIESGITDFRMEIVMPPVLYKIHQEIPGGEHYYNYFARIVGMYSYKEKGREVVEDPPFDECWLHQDDCPWWFSCGEY